MPMTASIVGNDPLDQFLNAHALSGGKRPIPLVSTKIDVTIRGGLASVTTERTFRNAEDQSIEATMTFPIPIDATLCSLFARIDGRTLHATAQAHAKARETYEDAVAKGKAAVLHEELLKGIHMVSVGHVRPGAEIVVTDTWTAPLSFIESTPQLRIPTTVGEIYGRTPLSPSEALVTGDHRHEATIAIHCENGAATLLRAGPAIDGWHRITLDAPIDITLSGWKKQSLEGVAADGRRVTLDIEPAPAADASLDVDILFDRSSSMGERAVGDGEVGSSKYEVARKGLHAALRKRLKATDHVRLWEFNDNVRFVGESKGNCDELVAALREPDGGTEIGRAFDAVIASGKARNVLIVTDGKSYALDPHMLARTGIRFTAVLIGDDALDAGVAHLAGMTGGQSFIAAGSEGGSAIGAAIEAARAPWHVPPQIEGPLSHVVAFRRGARLVASWGEKSAREATPQMRHVAATAAMLAIPLMREDAAAALAQSEGIVCHLTSLVLVDEAGQQQAGLPASRKIELAAPRSAGYMASYAPVAACLDDSRSRACAAPAMFSAGASRRSRSSFMDMLSSMSDQEEEAPPQKRARSKVPMGLRDVADKIDWEDNPDGLRHGDLSALPPDIAASIRAAAQMPEIVRLAQALGVDPVVVVIALLARERGGASRSAQRIARAILGKADTKTVDSVLHELVL